MEDCQKLRQQLDKIFEGAALATGCSFKVADDPIFADVKINGILAQIFEKHAINLGCQLKSKEIQESVSCGSTGNPISFLIKKKK